MHVDASASADGASDEVAEQGLPLAGIRVVDLTRALAGPFCTALLGDLGADIIKVEGLPLGDATRAWPPFEGDQSLYFLSTNRNKRSIALDLRTRAGQAIVADLVAGADVLVENFRPGVLAKLGLDPERLRRERPDLVICSITGFGEVGPLASSAGLDQIAQGMSGLMSVTGAGNQTPMRVGVPIADMVAGLFSAIGTLASLLGRARSGNSPRISTSLLEGALSLMTFQAQRFLSSGEVPQPQGNDHPLIAPYGTFKTSDGEINVAVGSDAHWRAICKILGAPDLAADPDYAAPHSRSLNRAALSIRLNELFSEHESAPMISELRAAGVPAGPIYAMDQVFEEPQVKALGLVREVLDGDKPVRLMRGPLWLDGTPTAIRRIPPQLGMNGIEILSELGYSSEQIARLVADGVCLAPETTAAT